MIGLQHDARVGAPSWTLWSGCANMKIGRLARQSVRYVAAILIAVLIGQIVQICAAALIDIIVGHEVTGGRWSFNVPNVITICIQESAVGCVAGAIAQQKGKLISAIAVSLTPDALMDIIYNRDMSGYIASIFFTKAALWAWIGPSLNGAGYFGMSCGL